MGKNVVPDSFTFSGGETGLLLVHGFTGTAADMRPMGRYFHERGYTVHAPLLTGHGTTPEDMLRTRWPDWVGSVNEGLRKLRAHHCTRIFAAGLSMGGILVLNLAQKTKLQGVISICAPMQVQDRRIFLAPLLSRYMPYILREEVQPDHIEQAIVPYDRTPVACVASLNRLIQRVKRHLKKVTAPIFVAQSRHDETVIPDSAEFIYNQVSSACKQLEWYENSGHILTLDHDKEQLFDDMEQFILNTNTD